jgi:hypothetical protein
MLSYCRGDVPLSAFDFHAASRAGVPLDHDGRYEVAETLLPVGERYAMRGVVVGDVVGETPDGLFRAAIPVGRLVLRGARDHPLLVSNAPSLFF